MAMTTEESNTTNSETEGANSVSSIDLFDCFVCSRTSIVYKKPCEEAIIKNLVRVDRRNIDNPLKNKYIGERWYEKGSNHRVENGKICRDFNETSWVVDISGEEAFKLFAKKYGRLILNYDDEYNPPMWKVEIYDDYRE